ncbi:uncharacterized protein [Haliotis cracherodii]|uniref:uncharacterized protein n=1 Tax=Haliotis cracherodii TaxID=6455 RepID=UPI0039E73462
MLQYFGDMGNSLIKAAALDFGAQWACWAVAAALRTEKFYDLAGSGTFFLLAWQSLKWGNTFHPRQRVATGMVMAWACRLGMYLFTRILKDGKDRRFNNVRDKPGVFLAYWTIQGVWVMSTLLPVLMLNSKKEDKPVSTRDYIGWALWALGFFFEAVGDYQKSAFRANPDNAGMFIKHGLWSLCRHPNYFGEILMWTGLYITSSKALSGFEHISVISPIFLSFLLTQVSGIPLLEKYASKKWGSNPQYQLYVKNTAKLVPYIW